MVGRMPELESWDSSAREYDNFEKRWHHYQNVGRGLVDRVNVEPHDKILELACGTGACTLQLANLCVKGEIVAIDQSESMIKIAKENLSSAGYSNATFLRCEVGQLANLLHEKSQFFDLAVCSSAFWQFPDQRQVLNNLHYLLKNYGRFGFSLAEWFTSEESREGIRKIVQSVLAKHGLDTSKLAHSSRFGRQREDYPHLLLESGFRVIKDEKYEFDLPEGARTAWRNIPIFSQLTSRSGAQSDAIPEEVREEIRNEIRRLRNEHQTNQENWKSSWRILVAERTD